MAGKMAQIIRLGGVDGFAAVVNGSLLELGTRCLWPTAEALRRDAEREGVATSPYIIDTRPVLSRPVIARRAAA